MSSPESAAIRSKAIKTSEGWWFKAVFDSFDPVLEPYGYELTEAKASFRGDRVAYLGSRYRIAFEFDWDTRTLRGELWDEARLDRENHLWVVRLWDLLNGRDPKASGRSQIDQTWTNTLRSQPFISGLSESERTRLMLLLVGISPPRSGSRSGSSPS